MTAKYGKEGTLSRVDFENKARVWHGEILTEEDIVFRAMKAEEDIAEGRVLSQEELEDESISW